MIQEMNLLNNQTEKVASNKTKSNNFYTRKNKYYTSIFLKHWNKQAMLDSVDKEKELHRQNQLAVIKPSKKCANEMDQSHNHEDFKPENLVNQNFKILGVNFKVINADDGNYWIETRNHVNNEVDQIKAFAGEDLFLSLHEQVFANITGTLLYF